MSNANKTCQWHGGCGFAPVPTERFCRGHRVEMIRKMAADGYLQELPAETERRKRAAREDTRATKFGTDQ